MAVNKRAMGIACDINDEEAPETVITPETPLMNCNENINANSVYKLRMQPIFANEGEIPASNTDAKLPNYKAENSIPPPKQPPPKLANYNMENSVPPPKGPPPKVPEISTIELQPYDSAISKPKHYNYDQPSIEWLNSIRTEIMIKNKVNPTKGLRCLFFIVILVIVCCVAIVSAFSNNIINIYIDMGSEGTYIWSIGWFNAEFHHLDDAICGKACLYNDDTEQIAALLPIPNTLEYMKNAGYLLITSVGIILLWIAYILAVLCERRSSHELLYLNCCCISIPQRASVYFAFDSINILSLACIVYYVMLSVYGYIETSFYLENICSISMGCWVYIIPHYGFCALLPITFPITFCALRKTRKLDTKFNEKTLELYYPDNAKKAKSESCSIDLKYLLKSISTMKMICILSFIMFVSFRDVGMISTVFSEEMEANVHHPFNMYFQFQGLSNKNEIIYDSHLNLLGSNITISTVQPLNFEEDETFNVLFGFSTTKFYWDYCIVIILGINMLTIAPYLIFVVQKYSSNKCMKSLIIGITFIEWLAHSGLMAMYYYEYAILFSEYIQSEMESELYRVIGSEFNVLWYPDWGAIAGILLWCYLIKLIYSTSKAM